MKAEITPEVLEALQRTNDGGGPCDNCIVTSCHRHCQEYKDHDILFNFLEELKVKQAKKLTFWKRW